MRRSSLLFVIIIFLAACSVGTQTWMDRYGIPSELVTNLEIKPPSPEIPEHLAKFSGIWCGNYKGSGVANCLAVMEISPQEAVVMRIWGDSIKYNAGFAKHKAKFKDGVKLYFMTDQGRENLYQFSSDYKELLLTQSWQVSEGREKQDWAPLTKVVETPKIAKTDLQKGIKDEKTKPAPSPELQIVKQPSVDTTELSLPLLSFITQLKDQNNNRVLDGGEEVSLKVTVENKGEGAAKDVQVILSGNQTLIGHLGEKRFIGDIKPGEKKTAEFKTILPAQIPSEAAMLKIELKEATGAAASEVKILKVAMRPKEIREVVEVISEINVDDIPLKTKSFERKEAFALVIGISKYREEAIPPVKYASRDAEVIARYLENVGGIPRSNIKVLTDASVTKSDLEAYIEDWLARRVSKDSVVFVYYAGHGAPDIESKEAYIVPYEGHPDFPLKLYSLKKMYESLNRLPAREVIVMLDSCFSGTGGRSVTKSGARPLVISIENPVLASGKINVLAAATGAQISSDYDSARHGLFTYFLLRGMRGEADKNANGAIELGELYDYVKTNVSEKASLDLNRDQTPVLLPSAEAIGESLKMPVSKIK
jgi:hypothetical protein